MDQSTIMVHDRPVVSIHDLDAQMEGLNRTTLAGLVRIRITSAIAAYRLERSPSNLLLKTAYTIGLILGLALFLFLVNKLLNSMNAAIERRLKIRVEGLQTKSFQLIQARQFWMVIKTAIKTVYLLLLVISSYLILNLILGFYPWTRGLSQSLYNLALNPLHKLISGVVDIIPDLIFLVVLVIITRYFLKLSRMFFNRIDERTIRFANFDREWTWPTYKIFRLVVIIFSLIVAYPYIPGSNSGAFKGISLFLGVIFSLGSTSFISNIIVGYMMTYRRAFKIGERIKVNDMMGEVVQSRLMVTHLCSPKNEEIVIPNSVILNSHIINYSSMSQKNGLILHTTGGIGYKTPRRQVEAMLKMAADRTPGLLKEPTPFVLQKSLGDFAVNYKLNVYCDQPQRMLELYTLLHQNILDIFNEYRVQNLNPAYEGDPQTPKIVPREQWFATPAPEPEKHLAGNRSAKSKRKQILARLAFIQMS